MNIQPKISIIIPTFNAGIYYKQCLDSIVNQTLREVEIIIVLDCPTDGSDMIAQEYARRDSRIKIIRNDSNLHIGLSRNRGIEIATGEYIAFFDHDDICELDMYEKLYLYALQENADMVISQPVELVGSIKNVWQVPNIASKCLREYVLSNLIGMGNYERPLSWFCNLHNCIYKLSLLKDNAIQFVDTTNVTPEDVLFNFMMAFMAQKLVYMDTPLYYHRNISTSTAHTYGYIDWKKRLNGVVILYEFIQQQNCYELYEIQFLLYVRRVILNALLGVIVQKRSIVEFRLALRTCNSHAFIKKAFRFYNGNESLQKRSMIKRFIRYIIVQWLQ